MTNTITANGITFTLTYHAAKQALSKGISLFDVLEAAAYPSCRYENRRHAGQMRHIKGDIVAVIAEDGCTVITVYANVRETAPRADQTDRDAQRYAAEYRQRIGRAHR